MRLQSKSGSFSHEMLYIFESSDGRLILDCETYIKQNIQKNFLMKEELPQGFSETMCLSKLDNTIDYLITRLGEPIFTKENK